MDFLRTTLCNCKIMRTSRTLSCCCCCKTPVAFSSLGGAVAETGAHTPCTEGPVPFISQSQHLQQDMLDKLCLFQSITANQSRLQDRDWLEGIPSQTWQKEVPNNRQKMILKINVHHYFSSRTAHEALCVYPCPAWSAAQWQTSAACRHQGKRPSI